MMRADNTAHLARAVQARQADTRRRAVAALTQLERQDEAITVSALAAAAGVARSWVYTQPDLLQRIRQGSSGDRRPTSSTDKSWQSRLNAAQIRIRDLTTENDKLRRQLAAAHGQRRTDQGL
ncbi:hypothetical protein ABIB25_000632 [Nakamurella sp. UYEF19]|uniref:DUF6262 family protein n=1 Tax=Nakamurella sp. UYEF19 TaxID=1756392 RepID=UPI00339948E4